MSIKRIIAEIKWRSAVMELSAVASSVLIFWGIWMIYRPAALIFAGLSIGIPYWVKTLVEIRGPKEGHTE